MYKTLLKVDSKQIKAKSFVRSQNVTENINLDVGLKDGIQKENDKNHGNKISSPGLREKKVSWRDIVVNGNIKKLKSTSSTHSIS